MSQQRNFIRLHNNCASLESSGIVIAHLVHLVFLSFIRLTFTYLKRHD